MKQPKVSGLTFLPSATTKKLTPYGACRLCTVEIAREQRSRLVTSCVYLVEDGLIVKTESEPVIKIRKMLLERMWARAPGVQAIRDYGIKYGISRTKFEVAPTFCILCGLCVRYCAEVKKGMLSALLAEERSER